MSLILGIETGTDVCSVSLSVEGVLLAECSSREGNDHARRLAPLVEQILADNGKVPSDLSAVAVSSGPGSYTGLRIGVSTAKGICFGSGIPLISVGSLYSLACMAKRKLGDGFDPGTMFCPMIDARRMEVYAQVLDHTLSPLTEVGAIVIECTSFADHIDSADRFLIFGNGAAKCRDVLTDPKVEYVDVRPSAEGLVDAAWEKFRTGEFEDTAYFEPFYLKDFVVTTSAKKLLLGFTAQEGCSRVSHSGLYGRKP